MKSVLKAGEFNCRVSSVLNKDVKQFGKKHLFDENDETCWNSDQGSPQWIAVDLDKEETVDTLMIQFQGGFVGKDCVLEAKSGTTPQVNEPFYPEDLNSLQTFKLKAAVSAKQIRIVFNESTDFFGRVIVYKLDLLQSDR